MSLTVKHIDRVIEMAWEDRTPFEAIKYQFNLSEKDVISIMRSELKPNSFKLWKERVQGGKTKHQNLISFNEARFKCSRQRSISNNKVSKR